MELRSRVGGRLAATLRTRRAAPALVATAGAAILSAVLACRMIVVSTRSRHPSSAALIFDCDGTLVDSETSYLQAFNSAVERLRGNGAHDVPLLNGQDWGANCCGRGLEYDAELAVRHFHLDGTSPAEFLALWKKEFHKLIETPGALALMPGFDALYTYARSHGMKVAVASSSDRAGLELKLRNGVLANSQVVKSLDDFDAVLCSEDVTQDKPHPEIYLTAAARIGVAPQSCWVIEDTTTGARAGKNAGMRVAAVPNMYTRGTGDFSFADVTLDSMSEVIDLL